VKDEVPEMTEYLAKSLKDLNIADGTGDEMNGKISIKNA
jgi:hypothetical protein